MLFHGLFSFIWFSTKQRSLYFSRWQIFLNYMRIICSAYVVFGILSGFVDVQKFFPALKLYQKLPLKLKKSIYFRFDLILSFRPKSIYFCFEKSWCLAGGRGCWLKGLHQIPSVSWRYHHFLHFHIDQIASFVPGILCPLYFY